MEIVNEIAQGSPCARVYRQRRYSRAVDFGIHATAAAIGLRRASKNKEMWTKKHCLCFKCSRAKAVDHKNKKGSIARDFRKIFECTE